MDDDDGLPGGSLAADSVVEGSGGRDTPPLAQSLGPASRRGVPGLGLGGQGRGGLSVARPGAGGVGGGDVVPPLEEFAPYETRSSVGTAKYIPPGNPAPRKAPPRGGGYDPYEDDFNFGYGSPAASPRHPRHLPSKTEKWREKGLERWPAHAQEQHKRQPHQFHKAEEVVPLRRTTANPQPTVNGELFTRSLREKSLEAHAVGLHNPTVVSSAVRCLFDREGHGFTGKTNAGNTPRRKQGEYGPHIKDWVERPVATGRMALDHMSGSRYAMNAAPRTIVPNSMGSPRSVKLNTMR